MTPVAAPIGPVTFTVRADPDATTVDATGGVIPATRLSLDFTASGEYPATGKRVVQAKAKGTLRWTNCDPTRPYTIPAGTVASTGRGIGFETDEGVPGGDAGADLKPDDHPHEARDVGVGAVKTGPSGNVGAGTVKVVPSSYNSVVIKVNNPAAMTGGKRDEFTRVQQSDIDNALIRADQAHRRARSTPERRLRPTGGWATAFLATGKALATPAPSRPLIRARSSTSRYRSSNPGRHGRDGRRGRSPAGSTRCCRAHRRAGPDRAGPSRTDRPKRPRQRAADGELVDFRVTAAGQAIAVLDPTALREAIKGKSVDEARTILGRYGTVSIDTWPGFVSSIPTIDARLDLTEGGAWTSVMPGRLTDPSSAP